MWYSNSPFLSRVSPLNLDKCSLTKSAKAVHYCEKRTSVLGELIKKYIYNCKTYYENFQVNIIMLSEKKINHSRNGDVIN